MFFTDHFDLDRISLTRRSAKNESDYSSDSRTVTPGLLHFAIFCQIFEKLWLKPILNLQIPLDCYIFFTFFCNSTESLL